MMEADSLMHSCVELQLPLEFVKEALIGIENDEKFVFETSGIFPTHHQEVNLTFTNMKTHLKITFDKLQFLTSDGVSKCIINSLEDGFHKECDIEANQSQGIQREQQVLEHSVQARDTYQNINTTADKTSIEQELVLSAKGSIHSERQRPKSSDTVKRKRGRPRKVKCNQTSDKEIVDKVDHEILKPSDIHATVNTADEKDKIVHEDESELTNSQRDSDSVKKDSMINDGKRYSLRGRKLNSKIMALVKGTGIDGNESEESVMVSDSNSDEEVMRFKKKIKRKTENEVAFKENKIYAKKIKEQVKEILSKGAVSETIKKTRGKLIDCKVCGKKICGYTAAYKHLLKKHKKTEGLDEYLKEISKLKECSCCFCGETFVDSSSVKNHKETAHKDVDFSCPLCNCKSKNLANLKMHVRNMHVEVGKKAFCHLCTASFRSHGSLRQHIDLNHFGNKHVSCEVCNKQFYNKSQLRRHMKAHGSDISKRFRCEICGKLFNFEYNLKRHLNFIHKPQSECFHCSYCGKGFSQKVPMITHVQHVHFNIFPYSCKECKGSFAKAPLLKEHMMSVHHIPDYAVPFMPRNSVYDKADEDKFYCSYCSESFAHKIRLIEHMHGDHADAFPFKCDICVQGFLEQSYLILHMLKAHGVLIQNEEVLNHSKSAGEIMQIITTKNGYPNKVMSALSGTEVLADSEEAYQEEQHIAVSDGTYTQDTSTAAFVENVPAEPSQSSSSLLVEVEQGSNTYQYVIEAPQSLGQSGSELAVQDIANLLIAAEQTSQEEQGEVLEPETSSVQEISLVIDDNGQSHAAASENQEQPVEVLLGQNDQNISLMSADNQGQPMEVVIDQNEQNSAVFTIENQAHSLQIEHGDIIEMNDSNSVDGKNYYRIINVLDNQ
ncbi:zinc finger and BTB domain-containing protein 41-like [Mercenaria mercenaria]|uniref:zinc finger and BTB domain-containing protein 41-like n=1 Tax=Mercenaria mercenaria TaxID=6596 RepID=UPI00234F3FF3|nr:zinc finger and BTB domain-containing protein 41-like [Mercenaria mercenaria]XP_053403889.1 zinc finger and BTB domain-containing protein 41-like [Mercenaria mercenaria]